MSGNRESVGYSGRGVVLEDEEEHYEKGVENLCEFSSAPEQLVKSQSVYYEMLPVTLKRAFGQPDGPDNEFCLRNGLKRHSFENVDLQVSTREILESLP